VEPVQVTQGDGLLRIVPHFKQRLVILGRPFKENSHSPPVSVILWMSEEINAGAIFCIKSAVNISCPIVQFRVRSLDEISK
jgi:hypothetical protein